MRSAVKRKPPALRDKRGRVFLFKNIFVFYIEYLFYENDFIGIKVGNFNVIAGHNHFYACGQLDRARNVSRSDEELRAIVVEERRMAGRVERGTAHVGDPAEIVGLIEKPVSTTITGLEMFHKSVDEAIAGFNNGAGFLLRIKL